MYDYLFHFNTYSGYWYAFHRDDKEKYFNGELESPLHSKDINILIQTLKTKIK